MHGALSPTPREDWTESFFRPHSVTAGSRVPPDSDDLYVETPNFARPTTPPASPLIAVVMKHADHLMRVSRYLHDVIGPTLERADRGMHMLVIDDEADDGSVLDRDVENGFAPDADGLKQVPRHVARLWAGARATCETRYENLFATYLAYTATPQANLLQSTHNPLSPTDFVATLRTPSDAGRIDAPRGPTYAEPHGLSHYYTGGEIFYRRFSSGDGALCITRPFPHRGDFRTQTSTTP